ncbi:helix-turn-helix domain-containing protein [Brevibacillus sp. SYP-B805]|uniref:helix-turn-helix domain-containing protein n=1 Tax=Brevibacillus sp. SYP-B805 TaxID=1578199 RepID=UPI0013ED0D47|nr:helix-turn-helix domain-containing protein [Brevibacillus sp. SYP-B805]NGQ95619.1 helix-turn-helix domain-containing protein [Brevibacillus sp. SYP-B805]
MAVDIKVYKPERCPECGCTRLHKAEKRAQLIRIIENGEWNTVVVTRRRYRCSSCDKKISDRLDEEIARRSLMAARMKRSAGSMENTIGNLLRKLRVEKNLTQQDVAAELNICRVTYREIEKGNRRLTASLRKKILALFHLSEEEWRIIATARASKRNT